MDKLILKQIAKRWCKGILSANEALDSFNDSGLTLDEIDYIQSESNKISERITDLGIVYNVDELVKEYYEF